MLSIFPSKPFRVSFAGRSIKAAFARATWGRRFWWNLKRWPFWVGKQIGRDLWNGLQGEPLPVIMELWGAYKQGYYPSYPLIRPFIGVLFFSFLSDIYFRVRVDHWDQMMCNYVGDRTFLVISNLYLSCRDLFGKAKNPHPKKVISTDSGTKRSNSGKQHAHPKRNNTQLTLPETNIAHENHHLYWKIPSKW